MTTRSYTFRSDISADEILRLLRVHLGVERVSIHSTDDETPNFKPQPNGALRARSGDMADQLYDFLIEHKHYTFKHRAAEGYLKELGFKPDSAGSAIRNLIERTKITKEGQRPHVTYHVVKEQ